MSTQVKGPDGVLIDFPEGTSPDTMRQVMAKRYGGPSTKKPPKAAPPYDPLHSLAQSVADVGTNASNAFFSLGDMLVKGKDALSRGAGNAAEFLMTGGGATRDPGTMKAVAAVRRVTDQPTTTMGEINNRLNPHAAQSPTRFASEMLGGMLMPIGPKGVRPMGPAAGVARAVAAPVKATPAAAKAGAGTLGGLVDIAKANNTRLMTSDVRPPTSWLGGLAANTAEKIPFFGTGGPRAAQQAERVAAIKKTMLDFGGEESAGLFGSGSSAVDDVAKGMLARRGDQLAKLT